MERGGGGGGGGDEVVPPLLPQPCGTDLIAVYITFNALCTWVKNRCPPSHTAVVVPNDCSALSSACLDKGPFFF